MDEAINEQLARVEAWLDDQAKNEKWTFKLYGVPRPNITLKSEHFKANNFKSANKDESLSFLDHAIRLYGPETPQYFLVRHAINNQDSKTRDFYIRNPFYDPSTHTGYKSYSSINGPQNNQMAGIMGMLEQERRHNSQMQDLRDQIRDLKTEKKLDELREENAALRYDNRNTMDKIQGFADSTLGQTMIGAILAQMGIHGVTNNPAIQGAQETVKNYTVQQSTKQDQPQQQQQQQKAQPITDPPQPTAEQLETIQKVNIAMAKLETVFPKQVPSALLDLATYCENNPGQAHIFRNLAKPQGNEQK